MPRKNDGLFFFSLALERGGLTLRQLLKSFQHPSGNWISHSCEVVCETVRKIIPPDLLRVANVPKLNAKCEKQGESEKIYKARKPLIKNSFVMFFLKFSSNQPKSHCN